MTKLNGHFLQQAMHMKGFDPKWCKWIKNYVTHGFGIKVNVDVGHYF
jgi:hypothetical protein